MNPELCNLQQRSFALRVYLISEELKNVFAWLWLWWRWSGKSSSDLAISGFAASELLFFERVAGKLFQSLYFLANAYRSSDANV